MIFHVGDIAGDGLAMQSSSSENTVTEVSAKTKKFHDSKFFHVA